MTSIASLSRVPVMAITRGSVSSGKRALSALVSMYDEFPEIPATIPTPSTSGSSAITTLPCGLTVVTEDASTSSTVSLTFPNGGSASESVSEGGSALANKAFAFKGASGASSLGIVRAIQNAGATPFTSASRHSAIVGYTCAREKAAALVGSLGTTTNSDYEPWDVADAIAIANVSVKEANSSAELLLTEQLYQAAFGESSSMGRSYFTPNATAATLQSFRDKAYVMNGAILAATGVDHDIFVKHVEESFEEANPGSMSKASAAHDPIQHTYIGGEARLSSATDRTCVALGFEGPNDSHALQSILKHCISLSGISSFAVPGLAGVYGAAPAGETMALIDNLCAALTSGSMTTESIEKAKKLAKSESLFALDDGSKSLAESMSLNVQMTGTFCAESIAASYDEITADDVNKAFDNMLKSNLTVASLGNISAVPYQGSIASRFS